MGVEVFAQSMFGNIVFGRPQATGDKDHICQGKSLVERTDDLAFFIGNGHGLHHIDPDEVELFTHPRGIGINGLANEQLIANTDDAGFHIGFL
jgi:hypothetical protein